MEAESFMNKICFHDSSFPHQVSAFLSTAYVGALYAVSKLRKLRRRDGSEAEQAAAAAAAVQIKKWKEILYQSLRSRFWCL